MRADEADRELLKRFIERTATAMVDRAWEVDSADPPDGTSMSLGSFSKAVGAEWRATVEFMLASRMLRERLGCPALWMRTSFWISLLAARRRHNFG